MTILDALPNPPDPTWVRGSSRWDGNFFNNEDETLLEPTHGFNNGAVVQLTDDTCIVAISRAERVEYINVSDYTPRYPTEVNYDKYVEWMRVLNGGLTTAKFEAVSDGYHDLVEIYSLTKLEETRALVALFLA
jgi:hypothetical protein